jgi:hypothetical protein
MTIIFSDTPLNKSPLFDSAEGWGPGFELASADGIGVVVGPGTNNPNVIGQQFQALPRQFFRVLARASSVTAHKACGCFQINWMSSDGGFLSTSIKNYEVTSEEKIFQYRVCAPDNATGGVLYVAPGNQEDVVRYTEMSLFPELDFCASSSVRISDSEKAVIVNIARTGGTSLGRSIMEHYEEGQVHSDYGESAEYDLYGHLTAEWFLNYLNGITPEDMRQIRVFLGHLPYIDKARLPFKARYITTLRNPITRVISGYSYGNLQGKTIPFEYFSFGLHSSASWSKSTSFQNPVSKVLLSRELLKMDDLRLIEQRIDEFDFVGVTEDMNWTTDCVLEFLRKSYPTVHHVNRTPAIVVSEIHPATIEAIKFRNWLDIHMYNKVCEKLNEERRSMQIPALEYCPEFDGGPFSSGDYHPELSCMAPFDESSDSGWLPCTLLHDDTETYLGYDFGKTRRESVNEIQIQPVGSVNVRLALAVEASDDGFIADVRWIAAFSVPVNDQLYRIRIKGRHSPARMWRIKFIVNPIAGEVIAVASLAFGASNPLRRKDADMVRNNIERILAKYNEDTCSCWLPGEFESAERRYSQLT